MLPNAPVLAGGALVWTRPGVGGGVSWMTGWVLVMSLSLKSLRLSSFGICCFLRALTSPLISSKIMLVVIMKTLKKNSTHAHNNSASHKYNRRGARRCKSSSATARDASRDALPHVHGRIDRPFRTYRSPTQGGSCKARSCKVHWSSCSHDAEASGC